MKKKILFILLILSITKFSSNAQSLNSAGSAASEKEVKQVIQNMFHAMQQADTSLLKTCFSDKVIFQTILNKPEGAVIKTESINDFIQSIGKQTPNVLDERIEFGAIQMDELMATVWTPYTFYYKGQYSHKGVNSFQLVRLKEGWKIQYLIDTRYK
jgi:competence protein ComGC